MRPKATHPELGQALILTSKAVKETDSGCKIRPASKRHTSTARKIRCASFRLAQIDFSSSSNCRSLRRQSRRLLYNPTAILASRRRSVPADGAYRARAIPDYRLWIASWNSLSPGDAGTVGFHHGADQTNFIDHGQRNISRQAWQRCADISFFKTTQITERSSLRFTLDVFNLTNTASFDIPIDDVSQNINFQGFPYVGQPSTIPPCDSSFTALYVCPTLSGLGITNKTIGSPRQIQMSMRLTF